MSLTLPSRGLSISAWLPWYIAIVVVILVWAPGARIAGACADAAALAGLLFGGAPYSSGVQQPRWLLVPPSTHHRSPGRAAKL